MKRRVSKNLLFSSWRMTDDSVEHERNVLKSNFYLVTGFVTINKIVYFQHLLVSFEELLSLRLSDPFVLVVGWINHNWLNLWKGACKVFKGISPPFFHVFPLTHLSIASPGATFPPPPGRPRGFDRFVFPGGGEFDLEIDYGVGHIVRHQSALWSRVYFWPILIDEAIQRYHTYPGPGCGWLTRWFPRLFPVEVLR